MDNRMTGVRFREIDLQWDWLFKRIRWMRRLHLAECEMFECQGRGVIAITLTDVG